MMSPFRHFEVRAKLGGPVAIVTIAGEFDRAGVDTATREVEYALADSPPALVIDMTACDYLDSSAMGAVLGAVRRRGDGFTRLVFAASPGSAVRRLFDLIGLSQTVPTYATVAEATAAVLQQPSPAA
jgi:anti-anti-sigma factor